MQSQRLALGRQIQDGVAQGYKRFCARGSQAETWGKVELELCSGHSQPKAHTLQQQLHKGRCCNGTLCLLLLLIPHLGNPLKGKKQMRSLRSWYFRNTGRKRI